MSEEFDADVAVVGSGFGGSVAALRFAEAGYRVVVVERGDHVSPETFEPDLDMFWSPERQRFGMNVLRRRGRHVVTWTGSAVGGGSHVYAATLKRLESFERFPSTIRDDDMARFYAMAEDMLDATEYPDRPPYSDVAATELLLTAGRELASTHPGLVEDAGRIRLGISFAPPGAPAGSTFTNRHGAPQRYADPRDQAILGGDIGSKNSLDRNYLLLAERHGATIESLSEADRISRLPEGGWQVEVRRLLRDPRWTSRLRRRWALRPRPPLARPDRVRAKIVVLAAGALGSTELLLRNRDVHRTLEPLSDRLGSRYTTNGDTLTLLLPTNGLALGWAGVGLLALGAARRKPALLAIGGVVHAAGVRQARRSYDPDLGPTNSDYIRFRGADGQAQGVYIEGGRYPNPARWAMAAALTAVSGYRPTSYRTIARLTSLARRWVPPFDVLARSLPIPLLTMGQDRAEGRIRLDGEGRLRIDLDLAANDEYYRYTDRLARMVARAAGARWLPNPVLSRLGIVEVPHNQGGVPMGESAADGVVDHAGRVFGIDDLVVLDGSVIPVSPGPNPALTILALAERAMPHLLGQLRADGRIRAAS